jgi:hypothetical protein
MPPLRPQRHVPNSIATLHHQRKPPERLTLRALRRNFLEALPRSTYEQAVTWIRGPLNDTLLLCDPDLIHEMLVEKTDAIRVDVDRHRLRAVFGGGKTFSHGLDHNRTLGRSP